MQQQKATSRLIMSGAQDKSLALVDRFVEQNVLTCKREAPVHVWFVSIVFRCSAQQGQAVEAAAFAGCA